MKTYLGDGAYAEFNHETGILSVTTENGIRETNKIMFEPEVYNALVAYVRRETANETEL